jgi:hypothetical protein
MRIRQTVAALTLIAVTWSSPCWAQARIATPDVLRAAIADQRAAEAANRDAVLAALDRTDVKQVAARLGLSVTDARTAVATMNGDDLATLAQAAVAIEQDEAGGASTIVISVTTLLLLLILIVLIAK